MTRLNQPPDPSLDFLDSDSFVFVASEIRAFDPVTGQGSLVWERHRRKPRVAFNHMTVPLEPATSSDFPPGVTAEPRVTPFSLEFVGPRTLRLRIQSRAERFDQEISPMLVRAPTRSPDVQSSGDAGTWQLRGRFGSVRLQASPFRFELADGSGRTLLRSQSLADSGSMIPGRPLPFSFAQRAEDLRQSVAVSFVLAPDEKIFGCGESFTRPNKRGQSLLLSTSDAHGSQSRESYKPIPFYLSSRGYAAFVHASTPMRFDLGHDVVGTQVLYSGAESLDLFLFLGSPAEVLSEYTALTGRSPLPPLWSFGLWMSRISYTSEAETRSVAEKLREHSIPCDVIHLDTGWFERDWCCDYRFARERFADPARLTSELSALGFRLSVWQLPYFSRNNALHDEIRERGLGVRGASGALVGDDAVLDFSNPDAVRWYQAQLKPLLELGIAAIKVDFGEAAPLAGHYHSGKSGYHEHNLYPLRYNRAAAEVTEEVHGYSLIWARSAWAGSQRYPLHWGGDAEATDAGMLGTLWGGLSFGLSGFSFWSHDIGGFFPATPRALYLRWLPFGAFSSHSRCHGLPPTEPWEFDAEFLDSFRRAVELRYRLMPYLYSEAAEAASHGHPLLRPLFFEFPEDPGSWLVEDAYLFGSAILVAPLFEEATRRTVYLPPGEWIDLQSEVTHRGPGFVELEAGAIPVIALARGGRALLTCRAAASTNELDFSQQEVWAVGSGDRVKGVFCAADEQTARPFEAVFECGAWRVSEDPGQGRVTWTLRRFGRPCPSASERSDLPEEP